LSAHNAKTYCIDGARIRAANAIQAMRENLSLLMRVNGLMRHLGYFYQSVIRTIEGGLLQLQILPRDFKRWSRRTSVNRAN